MAAEKDEVYQGEKSVQVEKAREWRCYRPYEGKGAAIKIQLAFKPENRYDKYIVFLSVAKENGKDEQGNPAFDWKGGKTVKLGENDLGSILAVIEGKQNAVKLFHETPNGGGNKVVSLEYNSDKDNYRFQVSAQDAEKNKFQAGHTISIGESVVLAVLLRNALERMFGW